MKAFKIKKNPLLIHQPINDHHFIIDGCFLIFFLWLIAFSTTTLFINQHYYHFTGNNYIHADYVVTVLSYCLLNLFCFSLLPELKKYRTKFLDLLYICFTTISIGFMTNAVQLTPFPTIDHLILKLEFLPLTQIIQWTNHQPELKAFLDHIYASLYICMACTPIIVIIFGSRAILHDYCRFLFMTVCIGFTFYYFYPSCGPASSIPHPHIFLDIQHDNHIKFAEIHQGLAPSTNEGGLIALPSFHIIWAWAGCRAFLKLYRPMFIVMLLWFLIMCCACVCLGWHYSVDIIASIALMFCVELYLKYSQPHHTSTEMQY